MIFSIKGENNTGKTALGLSFPLGLHYYDCDPGGFKRGLSAIKDGKGLVESGKIAYHSYPMPVSTLKANLGIKGAGMNKMSGMKELWYAFVEDFCSALEDPQVFSLVVDTFSQLYPIASDALLQEKQEAQEDAHGKLPAGKYYREQLIQIEYRTVNQRMHAIFDYIPEEKNLIIIHHMDDVWGEKIDSKGKVVDAVIGRDAKGWKKCGVAASDLADVVIRMEQKQTKPKAGETAKTYFTGTFTKAPPVLMGVSLDMPTAKDVTGRLKLVS